MSSCQTDPNKQIDEGHISETVYHSKEIGWTMKIPKGWNLTHQSVLDERTEKGLDAINESAEMDYDASGLKHLLNFQKNKFNIFQSTSELFEVEYEGEWEENNVLLKKFFYVHTLERVLL